MLSGFVVAHRDTMLAMAASRLRKLYPAPELDEIRDKNLSMLLDSVASALRAHEDEGSESGPRVATGPHLSGAQVSFDIDELVFQYESLCHSVNEAAKRFNAAIPLADQQSLNMALDDCIARTVIEWEHEKRKSRETNETERLGFVAHELRNALHTAINSFTAIRSGRVPLQGATASVVERSHARLAALIEQLIGEVRVASKTEEEQVPLPVRELLDEIVSFVSEDAAEKEIEISREADSGLEIEGKHDLLVTALTNLLQNAVKFTPAGGAVSVRAQATAQGQVVVEVEDQCGGLPANAAEQLFTPFVQAGPDRSGLGLGLAIVQRVVDAHGGAIEVKNLPGRGCMFVVRLPSSRRTRDRGI
jgi:signal transduction histidine kinase